MRYDEELVFGVEHEQDFWERVYVATLSKFVRHDEVTDPDARAAYCADAAVVARRNRRQMARSLQASRWMPIIATSPSGKAQFVCSVCGRLSCTPDTRCPKPLCCDDPDWTISCEEVERNMGLPPELQYRPIYVRRGEQ